MSGSPGDRRVEHKSGNRELFDTVDYKVAVGELELEAACDLLGVLAAGAEGPSAGSAPTDLASGRSRYGDMSMTRPDVLAAGVSKGAGTSTGSFCAGSRP